MQVFAVSYFIVIRERSPIEGIPILSASSLGYMRMLTVLVDLHIFQKTAISTLTIDISILGASGLWMIVPNKTSLL